MTETVTITVAMDVLNSLHAMASGQRGPLHVERRVMMAFEQAIEAACKPAAEVAAEPAGGE